VLSLKVLETKRFRRRHEEIAIAINNLKNRPGMTVNRMVAGSNPARGANISRRSLSQVITSLVG